MKEESKECFGNMDTEFEWSFCIWSDPFGAAEHGSMNRGHEQEKSIKWKENKASAYIFLYHPTGCS